MGLNIRVQLLVKYQSIIVSQYNVWSLQSKIDSGGDLQFWDEQDMQVLGLSKYGLELD